MAQVRVHRNCEGISRRDCVQLGIGSLFGAGLFFGGGFVNALRAVGEARRAGQSGQAPPQATSCILFWLDGGPSHFETFDPKPDAPLEIRGELRAIPTKTPGVRFAECLPRLAAISDKIAIVRSIRHNHGNHGAGNHYMMTGAPTRIPVSCGAHVSFHPSIGSVVARERPAPEGLPSYFSIPRMSRSGGPNFLGAKYAPFVVPDDPNGKRFRVRDVVLPRGLDGSRFLGRQKLREQVDRLLRIQDEAAADPVLALDEFYQQGNRLITSTEAQAAFDIHAEPDKVRETYGRTTVGQQALLARRLVAAGVPFVTVYSGGWDHHDDIFGRNRRQGPPLDQAIAALVEDLEQRGLLDSTLILCLGEFGRTPRITTLSGRQKAGRDHWANAMSVLFAGGGTPGGQVVGATDRKGYSAVDRILSPENFVSTIYSKLGIDPARIYYTPQGRPVQLVSDPTPIEELM